ncbi:hypothetical protein [Streptomyces hazeniae]|uniref:hypothetical protein n=1 Tax=Streptomyces hazeniae TaxID=3075538 RepID=UPI00288A1F66|nr:hypothetical protein [Streptomyces sp. DSM 42041]
MAISLSLSACSSTDDLMANAHCSSDVVSSREDAEKILELAPNGIDHLEPRFNESEAQGYTASCTVGDGSGREGLIIYFNAGYLSDVRRPSEKSLRELTEPMTVDGRLARVKSNEPGVGGVSGAASAILYAPCTLSEAGILTPEMREGVIFAGARAENASDPDDLRQRQNTADLALSFLGHAVEACDDPAKLPTSVHVDEA